MYLDIHRHSADKGEADLVMRNLFHSEIEEIQKTRFCSVGLHPWHVNENSIPNELNNVELAARETEVLAIGEAGLDKAIDTDYELQREVFLQQIEIAKRAEKPMIIHCVRAYDELQSFRKNSGHQQSWIFHWFNASLQTALDLINKDCFLSFGHMLFREQSKAFSVFTKIPVDRIFLETDDFDLSIKEVYKRAAELQNIPVENLQQQILTNFQTCFGIKL